MRPVLAVFGTRPEAIKLFPVIYALLVFPKRVAELERSEARYREIFESAPISLWEEDWSAVKEYIDRGDLVPDSIIMDMLFKPVISQSFL